jgi:hypothetical protein
METNSKIKVSDLDKFYEREIICPLIKHFPGTFIDEGEYYYNIHLRGVLKKDRISRKIYISIGKVSLDYYSLDNLIIQTYHKLINRALQGWEGRYNYDFYCLCNWVVAERYKK